FFFFFNDTATTEIYTLSLHDALPISLNAVHPRVPSDMRMIIFFRLPVVAEHLDLLRQRRIIGRDASRFAESSKVLSGIIAERRRHTQCSGLLPLVNSPVRLAGVLNYRDAVRPSNVKNRIHVRALPKQMHWHDRLGSRRDGLFQKRRIQRVGLLVYVHELWRRPGVA